MTKIVLDIGDREDGFCCESHVYYHKNKCPHLKGGGMGVYWCALNGDWVQNGADLPKRSKFCKRMERLEHDA